MDSPRHELCTACTRYDALSRRWRSFHGHSDERWPTQVTSNTYFCGVPPLIILGRVNVYKLSINMTVIFLTAHWKYDNCLMDRQASIILDHVNVQLNPSTPELEKYILPTSQISKTFKVVRIGKYNHLSSEEAMKNQVLRTVWFFWWGCRGNLKLITFESERVKLW